MYGSDAKHSAEPQQFSDLVRGIRTISNIKRNRVDKSDVKKYQAMKSIFEKSIATRCHIKAGSIIDETMLCFKKPGIGLKTNQVKVVIGRRALVDIPKIL